MAPQKAPKKAPLTNFHPFPKLPREVQMRIWRFFILDANKNRLVIYCAWARQIIPSRHLTSSVFWVTSLTYTVFKDLYPLKLPVFWNYQEATFSEKNLFDELDPLNPDAGDSASDESDVSLLSQFGGGHCGHLFLSPDHDIFVVTGIIRRDCDALDQTGEIIPKCMTRYFFHGERGSMKNIMEIVRAARKYTPSPEIPHLVKKNRHRYSRDIFSGVETCYHLYWFKDDDNSTRDQRMTPNSPLADVILRPGREVFEKWNSTIVLCDKKMLEQKLEGLGEESIDPFEQLIHL
ncbi:hypothetical protein F4677DRAFT_438189 [Hypoxylon crocopeplum]|nr:hypothetical protein F4677DRAFT_438189 [Hypoxylon crocopeplum]